MGHHDLDKDLEQHDSARKDDMGITRAQPDTDAGYDRRPDPGANRQPDDFGGSGESTGGLDRDGEPRRERRPNEGALDPNETWGEGSIADDDPER